MIRVLKTRRSSVSFFAPSFSTVRCTLDGGGRERWRGYETTGLLPYVDEFLDAATENGEPSACSWRRTCRTTAGRSRAEG